MYDISSKTVNKLSGELSTAFVDVAEENAQTQDIDAAVITDSGLIEQMENNNKDEYETSDYEAQPSETVETVIKKFDDFKIPISQNQNVMKTENQVLISSGYSVIKS